MEQLLNWDKPVFVDCDNTFCMNVNHVERNITKTKAILPVHFTGYMTDMVKLRKFQKNIQFNCRRRCQSILGAIKKKNAGTWGEFERFLFIH